MPRRTLRPLALRLGANLSRRRKAQGLTQDQVAEILEVEPITISRYETGTALPSLASMSLLAESLGTTMSVLLEESSDDAPHRPDAERLLGPLSPLSAQDRTWVLKMVDELVQHYMDTLGRIAGHARDCHNVVHPTVVQIGAVAPQFALIQTNDDATPNATFNSTWCKWAYLLKSVEAARRFAQPNHAAQCGRGWE
jgi:transcriptional regulator with XRE-family HTH domain